MRWKDIYFEIRYYPRRVLKYKRLWLWSESAWKLRKQSKRRKYRSKGYARLRNQPAKMKRLKETSCKYCSTTEHLTIDHIKPVSKGGRNNIENLQVLCSSCNQLKANLCQIKII